MAIIKKFKIGNTTIYVDDSSIVKTKEEEQKILEEFNRIAWKLFYSDKEEK